MVKFNSIFFRTVYLQLPFIVVYMLYLLSEAVFKTTDLQLSENFYLSNLFDILFVAIFSVLIVMKREFLKWFYLKSNLIG
jgi:hypothetical protein